jgi:isopentenyl diphosphate isomerase/L-lactate dehydrogenase-like FMN-dependent dehydrogenase
MPLVLKGLGRAEDALYAAEYLPAVKGVVVSNHGGRNLDGGPASADVLLQVTGALAAAGRLHRPGSPDSQGSRSSSRRGLEVYCDGGIRRGKDVFRALALGATAAFVGRPHQWGLSVAGQAGAKRVVQIFREELTSVMQLAGCVDATHVDRDAVMIKFGEIYSRL